MKTKLDDEIYLFEVILKIWNKKWILIFILFFSLLSTYFYLNSKKPIYLFSTEIKPISDQEELNYVTYNSYLSKINKNSSKELDDSFKGFNFINSSYLYSLFLDKLIEDSTVIEGIKKFKLVEKDDFASIENYNEAVKEFSKKINFLPPKKDNKLDKFWKIEIKIKNNKVLGDFLKFLEITANKKVKQYLKINNEYQILNAKQLRKFELEDLDINISNSKNSLGYKDFPTIKYFIEKLEREKVNLSTNKDLERLKQIFDSTPIGDQQNFYAGKFNIESITYINLNEVNKIKYYIIVVILVIIISLIFTIILNFIKKS